MARRYGPFVVALLLMTATIASAQSSGSDNQAMQALLNEIRLLRQDLRANAVASQRLQILVHRLEVQEAAVTQATREFNDAHSRVTGMQERLKRLNEQVDRFQEEKDNATDPEQTKQLDDALKQMRGEIAVVQGQQPDADQKEGAAEDALRTAQQKLEELEDKLDRVDRELEALSQSGVGSQR